MNVHSLSLLRSKTLAFLLIASFIFATASFTVWTKHTSAANLTSVSDTLSDSDLGLISNHTVVFSSPTGIALGDILDITFPDEFNVSTGTLALATDVDIDHGSGDLTVNTAACAAQDASLSFSGTQTVRIEFCAGGSGALAAGGTTTIQIGSHAASGVGDITNPTSAGSYEIQIGGTMADSADTRVVILDDVLVTAEVDTIFTFIVTGLGTSTAVNGTSTDRGSTATTLPFGTLAVGIPTTLAQNLQVQTNAANGFTVTLNQDQNLESSSGADIDRFIDDTAVASTTAWVSPSGNLGSEEEYGHMGITSEDETLGDADLTTHFYDDLWAGNFVGNAREVFYHDGPADGSTADQGSTTVGFQAEIMAFQEAGNDYQATITYVATPVF